MSSIILFILGACFVSLSAILLCLFVYIFYIHWITAHIPGPPRSSFWLGNLPQIWKYKSTTGRTTTEYLVKTRFEHGKIFVLFLAHRAVVFLSDASYLRHVFINNHKNLVKNSFIYSKLGFVYGERAVGYGLVTNTDEKLWHLHRHIMNPAYHRKCLRTFMTNFNNVCDRFFIRLDEVVKGGVPTSMVNEFSKVSCEAISQVSFNVDTKVIENPEAKFPSAIGLMLQGVQDNLNTPLSSNLLAIFQWPFLQNERKKRQIEAIRFLRNFCRENVESRANKIAEKKEVPNDLLTLLIQDGRLTMDEIIDQFLTIFTAGQDTTSNTLSFLLYEIITHPDIEEKILNEANEVLGCRDHINFEDLTKLTYFDQVLQEGLRKHPVAVGSTRKLRKSLNVGGYDLPSGIGVTFNQLILAMDPDIWSNPEKFDPERFAKVEDIPNFSVTHIPFSIGRRNCIGQTFAKFEIKVVIIRVLRKFKFQLLPGQTDRMEARLTIKPRDDVMCHVTRR